jgi:hypothetical protein
MPKYTVRWEVEVLAEDSQQAALIVKDFCRESTHVSQAFTVTDVITREENFWNILGCTASCCNPDTEPDDS